MSFDILLPQLSKKYEVEVLTLTFFPISDTATQSLVVECPVCVCEYPRSRMETMFLCGHTFCIDCTKGYYRAAIKEIKNAESLKRLPCLVQHLELSDDIKWDFFQYLEIKVSYNSFIQMF